jgi:hypothetical protein
LSGGGALKRQIGIQRRRADEKQTSDRPPNDSRLFFGADPGVAGLLNKAATPTWDDAFILHNAVCVAHVFRPPSFNHFDRTNRFAPAFEAALRSSGGKEQILPESRRIAIFTSTAEAPGQVKFNASLAAPEISLPNRSIAVLPAPVENKFNVRVQKNQSRFRLFPPRT